MITNKSRIPEELIYQIWQQKDYSNGFKTSDGQDVEILDPGQKNIDLAGPDFHNARIRIGNLTFNGDVEIDNYHFDWRSHGHHLNKRYNKVILHISLSEDSHFGYVSTQSGRKVYSIALEKYLTESVKKELITHLKSVNYDDSIKMPCRGLNDEIEKRYKLDFIKELGLLRHRKKCERFLHRLKELIVFKDHQFNEPIVKYNFENEINERHFELSEFENSIIWQQLFYEQVFEALGYSKNKNILAKLSKAADIKFFSSIDEKIINIPLIESILFNISGLIPDNNKISDEETSTYIRSLLENWSQIRIKYDGERYEQTDWNFFRLRPQNFPTVRLAAGSRILYSILQKNLINQLIRLFKENSDITKLIAKLRNLLIIKAEGYWSSHFNFNKPVKNKINYFLGLGRVDEVIVNIVLPFMAVYFDLFEDKKAAEGVLLIYINFKQKEGNKLVSDVSEVLGLQKQKQQSVIHQGMIELFRNYCIKQKCLECKIGKEVFN
jgi:hypothetical protein